MFRQFFYRKKKKYCHRLTVVRFNDRREIVKALLFVALLFTGSLALLGINYKGREVYEEKQGADICFIFDITFSMQAQNREGSKGTRMERMLEIFEDALALLGESGDNRVSAVAFGWEAWRLMAYPTSDHKLIRREVSAKVNKWNSHLKGRSGSNIGVALYYGITAFPPDPGKEKRKKIIILLSDGEPDGNISEIQKAITSAVTDYARQEMISMIIIGLGDQGREFPLPKLNENGIVVGFEKDRNGKTKKTRSNFMFLEKIAKQTNGLFIQDSILKKKDLNKALKDRIADAKKTGKKVTVDAKKDITAHFLFLFSALMLLFVGMVLKFSKK